jgi:CRP/FNR family transcriptional regulator
LKILKTSLEGQEKIFSIYPRENLVALSTLFNEPRKYPASGVALEPSVIIAIPIEELERAILSNEFATRAWFRHLNRRLEGVQQLLTDQVFIDAKDRFKKMIQLLMKNQADQMEEIIVLDMPLIDGIDMLSLDYSQPVAQSQTFQVVFKYTSFDYQFIEAERSNYNGEVE